MEGVINLPYAKDAATSSIVREGYFAAEYLFWKEFLKDSKQLLPEFERRSDEAEKAGESTIAWANLIPGCCTSRTSLKQQYLIALTWAHDCVEGVCNHFKKTSDNLKKLKSLADGVVAIRQQTTDKYDSEIAKAQNYVKDVSSQIDANQRRVVDVKTAIRELNKKVQDSCISSQEKKRLRRFNREVKQAQANVEKGRIEYKEAELKVKHREKDKQYRLRVLSLWRSLHTIISNELRKLDPEA